MQPARGAPRMKRSKHNLLSRVWLRPYAADTYSVFGKGTCGGKSYHRPAAPITPAARPASKSLHTSREVSSSPGIRSLAGNRRHALRLTTILQWTFRQSACTTFKAWIQSLGDTWRLNPHFMHRKSQKAQSLALLRREALWSRGFNRGAQRGWLARNNRKLSRIAART